jgi:hypothetical protein
MKQLHLAGYVSTNKCTSIVGCGYYSFQLRRTVNSKWQFLDCATVAFSERNEQSLYLHSYTCFFKTMKTGTRFDLCWVSSKGNMYVKYLVQNFLWVVDS